MITEMKLPKVGQTMEEGTIVCWKKKEGDPVNVGEEICDIETDKATVAIESGGDGILRKILIQEGQTVSVGTLIAIIAESGEDISPMGQCGN